MLKYIIDAFNGLLITSNIQQDTFIGNNTNVNGGLEQYDILLKRYKKLYQLELQQLLDYKDITVKTFITPDTLWFCYPEPIDDDTLKNILSVAASEPPATVYPSQVIIITNNTTTVTDGITVNVEFLFI
jgi:hypothetical protein